jgi:hypothetical protein
MDTILDSRVWKKMPEGYLYPGFTELWIPACSGILFVLWESAIHPIVQVFVVPWCKTKEEGAKRERRLAKMNDIVCKFIYFIGSSAWGYYVLKDEPYLPWQLGGSGDFTLGFTEEWFPFPIRNNDNLKYYILVTSGYHVAHFFMHIFSKNKRNDFVEMALHHICAVYLYGGLYLLNVWEIGATIAFLHDIADIFVNIVKFAGETSYNSVAALCMCIHMVVWFFTRNYTLPILIWKIFSSDIPLGQYSKLIFCYLLSCMFALHCFWFTLFVRMIWRFASEGVAEDI